MPGRSLWVSWDRLVADIAASGAGGLDTGSEVASTWYEIYAIAKDDGTKNALLHRALDWFEDTSAIAANVDAKLRDVAARTKIAQGFKTTATALVPFIDVQIKKIGTPTGNVWITIESDSSGDPDGTPLATSDKFDVSLVNATNYFVRFVFRNPALLTATTQYHWVLNGDFTINATNHFIVRGNTADLDANGVGKQFNGTVWSAHADAADLQAKVFIERNNTAVTMPSGFTGKALIGYVFNDSGSNFDPIAFAGKHAHVLDERSFGTFTATLPLLNDASTMFPPVSVILHASAGHDAVDSRVMIGGVPDAFAAIRDLYKAKVAQVALSVANSGVMQTSFAPIHTEFQAVYLLTNAGTAQVWVNGGDW